MDTLNLQYIAAPMVNQSDLPFRVLTRKYGATAAYSQMLVPERLINDQEYLEYHLRDLSCNVDGLERPVFVQLCGNDPDTIVRAGKLLQNCCDGIDLNLGCPQEIAREEHFGGYLLGRKDWPLVEDIMCAMSRSFMVPVSAKLRLCQPVSATSDLALRLESCGASWITLHARTVSARRRRQGAANLDEVRRLKDALQIPVISNGNVRVYSDLHHNLEFTRADGLMVGETLLGNPWYGIYSFWGINIVPDPVDISLEYLDICGRFSRSIPIPVVQTHVRHFVDFQCHRRPWFLNFRAALSATKTLHDIELLLGTKVERWRGRLPRFPHHATAGEAEQNNYNDEESTDVEKGAVGEPIDLSLIE